MHIDSDTQLVSFNLRERYILAQALVLGIEKLAEVEGAMREVSNMQDMAALLRSPLFHLMANAVLASGEYPAAENALVPENEPPFAWEDLPF